MFCWETLGPSPDPNLIKHPWDVQEQVQSMEAPPNCGSDFALDTGPVGVSCCVWHQRLCRTNLTKRNIVIGPVKPPAAVFKR